MEPLRAGNKCELLLKFINPTQHETAITLMPLMLPIVKDDVEKMEESVEQSLDVNVSSVLRFLILF